MRTCDQGAYASGRDEIRVAVLRVITCVPIHVGGNIPPLNMSGRPIIIELGALRLVVLESRRQAFLPKAELLAW